MQRFPEPVKPPPQVAEQRTVRHLRVIKATIWGIVLRSAIILFELFGVFLFGSAALLLDAVASAIDVFSSLFLLVCFKLAERPPDADHPFGHGRYEPLFGLLLGMMLGGVGAGLLIHQSVLIYHHENVAVMDPRAWFIPFIALILLEICYQIVKRTAKKENSPALEADAVHYRVDACTSLLATLALIAAAFFPSYSYAFDHGGALLISILMIILGFIAARRNLNQLMDKVPDPKFFEIVKRAALNVGGVKETEKIRIQLYGPDAHVDIDVEVDPDLSVELAHKISQQVRAEIQKEWPAVRDVTVHIEPYYPGDH